MKDDLKIKRLETLPYMFRSTCPCCNWTLNGNKRKNRRIVRKQARAKLRQELRLYSKENK
jgi:hypothetical protein